jgi:hypothetical protein
VGSPIILSGTMICVFFSLLGSAEAAPPEVLNKTVTVSWSSFLPANCSNGSTNRTARNVTQQIYISTQGRLFSKVMAQAGRYSKERLTAPSGSGQFRFSGAKIVATMPQASGAVQATITFDPTYQSCSAEVAHGSESGKPYVWINLAGVKCTATGKSTVSNVGCSVRQGNAFAN